MSDLSFKLDPAKPLPDKPLSEVDKDLVSATAAFETKPQLAGIKFAINASAGAGVEVFNSPDDKDDEGVLGKPVKDDSKFGEVKLEPQIVLPAEGALNDAWVKYYFEAGVEASAETDLGPVKPKIDASKKVVFADYRRHSKNDSTPAAVLADIAGLRFAASADDAFELGPKEALSYHVRGQLTASVTLAWSDVFTSSLTHLTQLFRTGKMLTLKIGAEAELKFHVGLVDDFVIVFTKGSGGKVRVALKKTDSREVGVAASLGVSVGLDDESAKALKERVLELFNKLLAERVDKTVAEVDRIAKKLSFESLTGPERQVVSKVVEALDLGALVPDLTPPAFEEFKERWEKLKQDVEATVTKVASAKVKLGFTYEYLRVRTEDTLLVAEMDEATFRRHHADLMKCELRNVLKEFEQNPAGLEKYLNQKTVKMAQSWGFSLAVGSWKFSGKDKKELTSVTQRNIHGSQRVAYLGMRGYEGKWLDDKAAWTVDFKAQMPEFSKGPSPTACEFEYGLYYKWTWEEKKLKEKDLPRLLDHAVVWNILALDDVDDVIKEVRGGLNKKAEVSLELTVDDETLRALLPLAVSGPHEEQAAAALALAMPYHDDFQARSSPKVRQDCYKPLWRDYFKNDSEQLDSYANRAARTLETEFSGIKNIKGLAMMERGGSAFDTKAFQDPRTFAGQIHLHGKTPDNHSGVHKDWLRFFEGLRTLHAALAPGNCGPHETLKQVFGRLASFWDQTLYLRAGGAYLIGLDKNLSKKINRALTISFKEGDTYTFASSV